jgi:hypothetical protein
LASFAHASESLQSDPPPIESSGKIQSSRILPVLATARKTGKVYPSRRRFPLVRSQAESLKSAPDSTPD